MDGKLLGLASAIAGVAILLAWSPAGWPRTIALAIAVCCTVTSLTGLLERQPWARPVEAVRRVALVAAARSDIKR